MDDILIRGGDVMMAPAPQRAGRILRSTTAASLQLATIAQAPHATSLTRPGGHVIAPGFIDVKTHSDFTLTFYPRAENRVLQGVSTELVGSCGFTAAPIPRVGSRLLRANGRCSTGSSRSNTGPAAADVARLV